MATTPLCWLALLGTLASLGLAFLCASVDTSTATTAQHRVRATVAGSV